ncbi:MAG: 2-keto-4-pentenoate hydratase [Rhizobacter sp.]|nr:2-keto-4-pentenoate hydratase [Rhizobacter sp.]
MSDDSRDSQAHAATLKQVADLLMLAHETGTPCPPVRELLAAAGNDGAYAVQQINTERWLAQGRRIVGRKIGLTSLAVQKQLGVDQPDFGMLYADMAYGDNEEVPWHRLMQPKVEAEVALVLERDLPDEGITGAELIRATAYALPAIEIVGSRIAQWNIRFIDTVADNASSGLYVLGHTPVKLDAVDLRLAGMVMERGGEPVSFGVGAACLGHPLNAALWLARTMARLGQPLKAGDTVLTGALGPMAPVKPGDVFEARINGLGSVRAAFGPAA